MIRRVIPGLLIVAVVVAGLVAQDKPAADQDEPPVRLKKKDRPKAEQAEPDNPKEEGKPDKEPPPKPPVEEKKPQPEDRLKKPGEQPDMPEEPEVDEQEVLNRALKSSRNAEERLANKETDDRTQQAQRDVLKELDSLIDLEKQAQQNQDQQQQQDQDQAKGEQQQDQDKQNGKAQQQKGAMGGGKGRGRQQVAQGQQPGGRRQARRTARGNRQGSGQQQQGEGQDQKQNTAQDKEGQGGRNGKNGGGGGGTGTPENNLADVYKDVWGHLPEALRNEMSAYSREEFMAKYKDVLKQYYATIAEKGRKRD